MLGLKLNHVSKRGHIWFSHHNEIENQLHTVASGDGLLVVNHRFSFYEISRKSKTKQSAWQNHCLFIHNIQHLLRYLTLSVRVPNTGPTLGHHCASRYTINRHHCLYPARNHVLKSSLTCNCWHTWWRHYETHLKHYWPPVCSTWWTQHKEAECRQWTIDKPFPKCPW